MLIIIAFGSGIIVGAIIIILNQRKQAKAVGTLQIIETTDEEPYMFLSLNTDIDSIIHESTVVMRVTYKRTSHK